MLFPVIGTWLQSDFQEKNLINISSFNKVFAKFHTIFKSGATPIASRVHRSYCFVVTCLVDILTTRLYHP